MKKILLGILLCTGVAFAEPAVPPGEFDWPTTPVRFKVVSVLVDCEWKGGRPFASRGELAKLLHISAEGDESVDVIEALTEKGWLVRHDRNGDIEAINPNGVSKGNATDSEAIRQKNLKAPKYTPPKTPPPRPTNPPPKTKFTTAK